MTNLADWYLGQILIHGWAPVLATETAALLATWCAIGAAWHAIEHLINRNQPREEDQR